MKRVITALSNSRANEKMQKYKEIKLLLKDIQYQEGVIEAIEEYPEIDFLILSEILPGQMDIKELIEEIENKNKKINIILILKEESIEVENYYKNKDKIITYYNNEIEIEDIVKIIISNNQEEELKNEIIELKKIICETNKNLKNMQNKIKNMKIKKQENKKYVKSNIIDKERKILEKEIEKTFIEENKIIKISKNIKKKDGKVITILGLGGVGKSVFTVNLAQAMKKNKKDILIIDLDIFNNSIHTLLGVEKYPQSIVNEIEKYKINYKQNNDVNKIRNIILRVDKNINLISGIDLIFNNGIEMNKNKLTEFIKREKENYDAIIVDTSCECNFEYAKCISKISDKLIFLSEANIIQMKKTINLLNIYSIEWNIQKEKINIVFNKNNSESLDEEIIFEIFKDYKIIGEVNYIKYYNTLINNNMKNVFIKSNIKNQYMKIQKKLLKNEKIETYYLDKMKKE